MKNIGKKSGHLNLSDVSIYPFNRHFECFLAIVKSGTISGAAESLDMDQGNLSKILKQLETKLGHSLFHRHHKGLKLTEKGGRLFRVLDKMFDSWKLGRQASRLNEGELYFEPLRIGCHASVGHTYLPQLLSFLRKKNWPSPTEIHLDRSSAITRRVMERKLDIGIVASPVKSKDVIVRRIAVESLELVAKAESDSESSLLFNPQMLFAEGIIRGLSFAEMIEIEDYELIAQICADDSHFMGILPSSVRSRYPKLHPVKVLKNHISIALVTFPKSNVCPIFAQAASILE